MNFTNTQLISYYLYLSVFRKNTYNESNNKLDSKSYNKPDNKLDNKLDSKSNNEPDNKSDNVTYEAMKLIFIAIKTYCHSLALSISFLIWLKSIKYLMLIFFFAFLIWVDNVLVFSAENTLTSNCFLFFHFLCNI